MGEQVASMLKALYNHLPPDVKSLASLIQNTDFVRNMQSTRQTKPYLDEVMESNAVGHIYGRHDEKEKRNLKEINNVHI
ncbi:jg14503 [Pararge aegeria aegeria]|uniref:Jg14503 protein n=1 Tax=Pararge aegeria aegeria TaxID=348720 RepID=A0A8S4S4M0_9NEOP|nr:jg14503 [Pararge aegeria aegeria]